MLYLCWRSRVRAPVCFSTYSFKALFLTWRGICGKSPTYATIWYDQKSFDGHVRHTLKMLKYSYLYKISMRTLSFGEIMPISKIEGQFRPFDVLQVHDWLFRKCTRSLLPVHDWKFRRTYEVSTDLEIMAASLQILFMIQVWCTNKN